MTIEIEMRGSLVDVKVVGALVPEDLASLFGAMCAARERGPFVMVTDTLKMKSASHSVLPQFSEGLKRLPPMTGMWLGDAVVVSSPVAQFALSTLMLLAPLPTEMKVFGERPAALEWCSRVLLQAGEAIELRNRDSSGRHKLPSGSRRP
jgi:hypothetical protein